MKNIAYYVLYSPQNSEELPKFLQQKNAHIFSPLATLSATQILTLGNTETLFNTQKAFEKLNRQITAEEIAHTLSHIKCWKAIAENEALNDEDFALVAEGAVNLVNDFQCLAQSYANKYPSYAIIKLQRDGKSHSNERLFQEGDEPDALIYGDINQYHYDCALYLIRKDLAKKLTALLSETKPYWLADHFTEFHEAQNIAQARYLLGELPQEKLQEKVENPLFSIIVPIYNVERYLEQCIESVLAQDYHNYELILVDDGSPDNSIDICVKYAKKYKNIVFIHKTNGGLSDARNAGIQIARGEYLMFLDSDDYWDGKNILSEISNIIFHNQPDLIIYDMAYYYDKEGKIESYFSSREGLKNDYLNDFYVLTQRNIYRPSACNKIVKRNFIIENNLLFKFGTSHEDLDWSFDLAQKVKSYFLYNKPFYIYRTRRKGSITEFVKVKNTEDLLDIGIRKIKQLKKTNKSFLYNGLKQYILNQERYIKDSFHLLSNIDKDILAEKFIEFEFLIEELKK